MRTGDGHDAAKLSAINILEGGRKRQRVSARESPSTPIKPRTASPPLRAEDITKAGYQILDVLLHRIDPEDETLLAAPFMELPSASDYPDYYQTIRHPISLYIIEERLERGRYSEVADLKRDLEMVCNNAKRYNMRDTPIWTKAKHLHALIKDAYSDVIELGRCSSPLGGPASPSQSRLALSQQPGGLAALRPAGSGEIAADADGEAKNEGDEDAEGESETETVKEPTSMRIRIKGALGRKMPNEERLARAEGGEDVSSGGKSLKDAFKEVIADLNAAVSAEGTPLTDFFTELPSRKDYPDYYQLIPQPISMFEIENKIDAGAYRTLNSMMGDLRSMLDNAQTYNEDDSEVYEDAAQIRTYLEKTAIPKLYAQGFTLDPADERQSARAPENISRAAALAQADTAKRAMTRQPVALAALKSNPGDAGSSKAKLKVKLKRSQERDAQTSSPAAVASATTGGTAPQAPTVESAGPPLTSAVPQQPSLRPEAMRQADVSTRSDEQSPAPRGPLTQSGSPPTATMQPNGLWSPVPIVPPDAGRRASGYFDSAATPALVSNGRSMPSASPGAAPHPGPHQDGTMQRGLAGVTSPGSVRHQAAPASTAVRHGASSSMSHVGAMQRPAENYDRTLPFRGSSAHVSASERFQPVPPPPTARAQVPTSGMPARSGLDSPYAHPLAQISQPARSQSHALPWAASVPASGAGTGVQASLPPAQHLAGQPRIRNQRLGAPPISALMPPVVRSIKRPAAAHLVVVEVTSDLDKPVRLSLNNDMTRLHSITVPPTTQCVKLTFAFNGAVPQNINDEADVDGIDESSSSPVITKVDPRRDTTASQTAEHVSTDSPAAGTWRTTVRLNGARLPSVEEARALSESLATFRSQPMATGGAGLLQDAPRLSYVEIDAVDERVVRLQSLQKGTSMLEVIVTPTPQCPALQAILDVVAREPEDVTEAEKELARDALALDERYRIFITRA